MNTHLFSSFINTMFNVILKKYHDKSTNNYHVITS